MKNADISVAMGADKARHVRETGAEVLVAGDSSCLMHIGGRAVAAAGRRTRDAPGRDPGLRPRAPHERHVRRDAGVPGGRARGAGRHPAAAQPGPRHPHDPRQAGPGGRRGARAGRSCARPAPTSRTPRCADLDAAPRAARGGADRAAAPSCTGRATPPRPAGSSPRSRRRTASTRSSRSSRWSTQEIGLNEALAAEGIAAWETDLAELIVQLGDDLPSHILVPAIHRNRAEIREIFRTRMAAAGRPAPDDLTDDPAELADAARLHLREKFLRAKVGGLRRQLRRRRDRHPGRRRVRGQRPDVPDPARGAGLGGRHREGRADLAPTSTSSCGCCRARRPASG